MMRNVSNRDLSRTILGNNISMPIGISPTSLHQLCHKDGELATARAASYLSIVMTLSMLASKNIEEVPMRNPSFICFQQVFITDPKEYVLQVVRNAERNNLKGIVVTLDQPVFPIRHRDLRNKEDIARHCRYVINFV